MQFVDVALLDVKIRTVDQEVFFYQVEVEYFERRLSSVHFFVKVSRDLALPTA